jgi:serine/threonine protein kinase
MSQDGENAPPQPSLFAISQDSMASQSQFSQSQFSQFSQDFAERMGGLAVHDMSSFQMMNDDSMCYSQSGGDNKSEAGGGGGVVFSGNSSSISSSYSGAFHQQQQQGLSLSSAFKQQKQSQNSAVSSHGGPPSLSINTSFGVGGVTAPPPHAQDGIAGAGTNSRGTPLSAVGAPEMTFQVPVARERKEKSSSSSSSSSRRHTDGEGGDLSKREKIITLAAPIENPFLPRDDANAFAAAKSGGVVRPRKGAPQTMWISAFKERSKYVSDFEQIDVLGEGQFSVVCYARKRLDGVVYAIKKLKTKINGEKGGILMAREACAHAALVGCPNLTQYFNCWLDDGILCIQTELCGFGSLESLVASLPLVSHESGDGSGEMSTSRDGVNVSCEQGPDSEKFDDDETQDIDAMNDEDESSHKPQQQQQQQPPHREEDEEEDEHHNSFNYGTQTQTQGSNEDDSETDSGGSSSPPAHGGIPEPLVWLIMSEVASTLAYMHNKEMVHLDIRPSNIFIGSTTGCSNLGADGKLVKKIPPSDIVRWLLNKEAQVKVGDLGQCCRIDDKNIQEGESRYCARELINEDEKLLDLYKADVFSLGATLYELMLGRRLHTGEDGNLEWHSLRDGTFAPHVDNGRSYSAALLSALRALMAPLPCNRPAAAQIVELCQRHNEQHAMLHISRTISPTAASVAARSDMEKLLAEMALLREENAQLKRQQ